MIEVHRIADTLLTVLQEERALFDTVVDIYYSGRRMNFIKEVRKSIPTSSVPSIEASPTSGDLQWSFLRVLEDTLTFRFDITTDNGYPELA